MCYIMGINILIQDQHINIYTSIDEKMSYDKHVQSESLDANTLIK